MNLSILYRGSLSSCNYGCDYCPFAKRTESKEQHEHDERELLRFINWVGERKQHRISILFTPWGEALIHKRYQNGIAMLTKYDTVEKVAIQTNLSCKLDWVEKCDKSRLALWTTFHPTEVPRQQFLSKCLELVERNIRFSVGVVGLKEHINEIELLRSELPSEIYMWINAYKRVPDYYSNTEIEFLKQIDPLFSFNNQYHPSIGSSCRAGSTVISVAGDGTIKRCHFIDLPIGNIYDDNFESCLAETPCTNETCGCHIGYVHLDKLGLYDIFSGGILERIPALLS